MVTDGGSILQVTGATPPFGTQQAFTITDKWNYEVDVLSDSPVVAGRLYWQVNDTCCDLNVDDPTITRFLQNADTMAVSSTAGPIGAYTITFRSAVQPCLPPVAPGLRAFVVPVLASEGFTDNGATGISPDGLGVVDNSHYWTVSCAP